MRLNWESALLILLVLEILLFGAINPRMLDISAQPSACAPSRWG